MYRECCRFDRGVAWIACSISSVSLSVAFVGSKGNLRISQIRDYTHNRFPTSLRPFSNATFQGMHGMLTVSPTQCS